MCSAQMLHNFYITILLSKFDLREINAPELSNTRANEVRRKQCDCEVFLLLLFVSKKRTFLFFFL